MKISVRADKYRFRMVIPNAILLSKAGLSFLKNDEQMKFLSDMNAEQRRTLKKTLKRMKKIHKKTQLLHVKSDDAEVIISL